jgi:NAD-dependent deacetylase
MNELISKLKKLISTSDQIVAFTGAGFSAESGISTFRGAGGLWSKYDPSIYADINFFIQDPTYYWSFFRDERYPVIKKAKPNDGHYALVELEKLGKLYRIITQNIDGLHQVAGSSDVIELHGNTRKINCTRCDKTYSMDEAYGKLKNELPPRCSCGAVLKPGTVLFGEPLPQVAIDMALIASKNCDMFLVLGSSLVVYPAASMPRLAKKNGSSLVIINIDPTPMDNLADIVINESASKVLSAVIDGG